MTSAIFTGLEGPPDRPADQRAVFIDKDGTLVENVPHNVDPARLRFTPHAMDGLRLLADRGFQLIVVTNQPGLAYGLFTRAALTRLQLALAELMQREGVRLADFYACPHAPAPPVRCRAACAASRRRDCCARPRAPTRSTCGGPG